MSLFGKNKFMTLEKAIEMGEYEPKFLMQFDEFAKLPRYSQFQLIQKALNNRRRQLQLHWADLNNQLDFSKKPYLESALKNVQKKIDDLKQVEEDLLIEYSA